MEGKAEVKARRYKNRIEQISEIQRKRPRRPNKRLEKSISSETKDMM